MSFSIGIIGLPNVGKSTLFKALTQQEVDISNYPFCTINPNVGIVQVPDERLEKISEITKPQKITPTIIEFVDIAGLVKGAHKGEGLGNQFLARIREVEAIVHVIRAFPDKDIKHIEETVDIQRDIDIVNNELRMKDLEIIDKRLEKIGKEAKSGHKEKIKEFEILQALKKELSEENRIPLTPLTGLNLLIAKPVIYILNIKENENYSGLLKSLPENTLPIDLKIELECTKLSPQELKELNLKSRLDILVKTCYKILDLVTFYTIKG